MPFSNEGLDIRPDQAFGDFQVSWAARCNHLLMRHVDRSNDVDIAIDNDYLDEDRDDPRLFAAGPVDLFRTQREWEDAIVGLLDEPPIDMEDITEADLSRVNGGHETWELDL